MKNLKIKKIIFIIFITFILILINSDTIYAVSSKEEIDRVKELIEEQAKKDIKRFNYTEYRCYVMGGKLLTDSKTGKKYPSSFAGASRSSNNSEVFKLEDIAVKAFKEYFDRYLTENVTKEERLVDYFVGYNFPYTRQENYKDGDDIEFKISAFVCPASEDTIWAENKEKVYVGQYDKSIEDFVIVEGYNTEEYYLHLVYEDGKYVIKYIDTKPEGYDDFVERMKTHGIDLENMNYAELINAKSEKEIIAESAETYKLEAPNSNVSVEKINVVIVSIFSFLILVTLFMYLKNFKSRKNHE